MSKNTTPAERIDDAINYITRLNFELGTDLHNQYQGNTTSTIGEEISLRVFAGYMTKDKRTALRALLLCQKHYFKRNSQTWKTSSLGYWKFKSKNTIDHAILLFTATCSTPDALADVAVNMGRAPLDTSGDAKYKLSGARNQPFNIGGGTCYPALMAWLLKSGLVSFQWFVKASYVKAPADVRDYFGTPREIWPSDDPFPAGTAMPPIPRGHIVHFFDPFRETFGHWMVSLGDGFGVGCNNFLHPGGATVPYDNRASLSDQFHYGYKQPKQRGVVYVYDPSQIPDRRMLDPQ